MPVFVVTHRARPKLIKGETTFTFVTDGIESAVGQAKAAAREKKVGVGGASTAQQVMKAGLLNEIQIHLVPILFGGGRRLFEAAASSSWNEPAWSMRPASRTLDSASRRGS